MPNYADIEVAVADYVRAYVRALREHGTSWQAIGRVLGTSHVWPQQILNTEKYGKRNPGPEIEHRVAQILHGGSVDALRRAAVNLAAGGGVIVQDTEGVPLELARESRLLPESDRPDRPEPARGRRGR